ncbi:hypothetical protein GGD66_007937 [Bradyrhizobium sp. CIR48]|uniref:hypothetical protein n=1 Tax=unclassified Bradyrhizobium TaxID=2631580 RepID=UPI0016063AA1|nr:MULTISPECIES: hypothetical protein [unclassified Bradyrhizobium]MBB4366155.1 hypothetical protein [Bradyrhizobium sp. CIR18]MBB4429335.1 hypothetical protein [Bradyrhizobium sp. CIR48]
MPISRLIENTDLTREQEHVLELAFKNALRKLDLVDRDDPLCGLVAQKMIDIQMSGVSDAVALVEMTVRESKGWNTRASDWCRP